MAIKIDSGSLLVGIQTDYYIFISHVYGVYKALHFNFYCIINCRNSVHDCD